MFEFSRFLQNLSPVLILLICLLYQNLNLCLALNREGLALLKFRERVVNDPFGALLNWNEEVGVIDPCSWFGIECTDGSVVILNLKNLCLGGTIAPDLHDLVHLKSIILRNNSFSGMIPEEIGELKNLKVLDLGYNNFSGTLPSDLNIRSLTILLLDNNQLFSSMPPEIDELNLLSEAQKDEYQLSSVIQTSTSFNTRWTSWETANDKHISQRRLLFKSPRPPSPPLSSPSPSPSSAHSAVTNTEPISPPSLSVFQPVLSPPSLATPVESPSGGPSQPRRSFSSNQHRALILSAAIGGPALLFLLAVVMYICRNKVCAVKPWASGLSGQLQKAFVAGVPKLKRLELEAACEDFSNVIGSSSTGTVYKGTLSSGIEIAVRSFVVASSKDWAKNLESQFRRKIDQLSKLNHKNFVNLIGYCVEEEPFTRMMVFEYSPNGTLFEHLHIREAEHLDWSTRMRIAMGMAYCLEHMHQQKPAMVHKNLNSSAVTLTEDYAAKIADFGIWNEITATEMESNSESNVYSFGVIFFETITGRLPYSVDRSSSQDWASDFLRREQPLREIVDPTLSSFDVDHLDKFGEVIKSCCCSNPVLRPTMQEVTTRLREITGIGSDGAVPRLSPLWWAELEITSSEAV